MISALRSTAAWALSLILLVAGTGLAQDANPQEPISEPLLRLETGGPATYVTALAFSPDSQTLYAGGWDKVVRAWKRNRAGHFVLDKSATIRVPIGPGLDGAINAIAVSPHGDRVAVAGKGLVRGAAGFRHAGRILPTVGGMTKDMRRDEGTIHVVQPHTGEVRQLRGHLGPVLSLAFAPEGNGRSVLVSAGQEWDAPNQRYIGTVRAWDLQEYKYLGGITLPEPKTRPQLAVRRTGTEPAAISVAITLNDGTFRVWDVSRGTRVSKVPDGQFNNTVTFLPGRNVALTGSYDRGTAWLRFWNMRAGQPPQRDAARQVQFAATGNVRSVPRALALVPSPSGRGPSAAVALLDLTRGTTPPWVPTAVQLQLVDLDSGAFGRVEARFELWKSRQGSAVLPEIAASADGAYLAVAGGPDHEILVYPLDQLRRNQLRPQRLRSRSSRIVNAWFARRGQDLGLVLKEGGPGTLDPPEQADVLVFDFRNGRLQPAGDAWRPARPEMGGWRTQLQRMAEAASRPGQARWGIFIEPPADPRRMVKLPVGHEVTTQALLPAAEGRPAPLLAVATHERGQPMLAVYDGATGKQLRQLTGHTQRIVSLAFSADGRLLASAGDDRKVCVWSLTDLDTILGRRGMLPGVTVQDQEDDLVVTSVEEDSPVRQHLSENDRLLGHVVEGQLRPWREARGFYDHWWQARPGTNVTVRRVRESQPPLDVSLQAVQGIDERKPLFSFFVSRPGPEARRQWIGWSPLGSFESSDRQVERYLGWHFNTGDGKAPTRFADLNQYRDRYFREGLLAELVKHGRLRAPPRAAALPRPRMSLSIPELGLTPEKSDGHLLVRRQEVTLSLELPFDFPADQVEDVECRFDGASLGKLVLMADSSWLVDLSTARWDRGVHQIEAVLRTREPQPQRFTERIVTRYQPPPPEIRLAGPSAAAVKDNTFNLQARVTSAAAGEKVHVEILRSNQQEPLYTLADAAPLDVSQTLPLEPGENYFEIVAKNANPLKDFESYEAQRRSLVITRIMDLAPPQIVLQRAETISEDLPQPELLDIEFGQPLQVDVPTVRVQGKISATEELEVAELRRAMADHGKALAGFASRKHKEFDFSETLTLKPGPQTFSIRAKAKDGTDTETKLQVEYRPQLPEVTILSPTWGEQLVSDMEMPEAELRARLELPEDSVPFRASVLVNGQQLPEPAAVDQATGTLRARIPLSQGENRIQVRLSNDWREATSDPVLITYAKPPVVNVEVPKTVSDALFDLKLQGQSASEITGVELEDMVVPRKDWQYDRQSGALVARAKVAHEPDVDWINLYVYYAKSPRPVAVKVPMPKLAVERKPLAEIEILSPGRDTSVTRREGTVEFQVRSPSLLARLELRQNRLPVYQASDISELQPDRQGRFHLRKTVSVRLRPGENHFELIADNEGGRQKETVTINYVELPVSVVIDGLVPQSAPEQFLEPRPGVRFSQPAPEGRVQLEGRVIWPDRGDRRLDDPRQRVQVWVNGFQQLPALLEPARGGLQRKFKTKLLLGKNENLVEVGLPGLEYDTGSRLTFQIPCREPLRNQRLHLLIVGVGQSVTEERKLVDRSLEALRARRTARNEFKTPAFAFGRIYGPLTGEVVSRERVITQLLLINRAIQELNKALPSNDVVLIYYHGGELVYANNRFYLTTDKPSVDPMSRDPEDLELFSISSEFLSRFVESTRGAHLMLLDVARTARPGTPPVAGWPNDSHGAMLRFAWLQTGGAPDDARLITALEEAVPRSSRLDQVDAQLAERSRQVSQRYPRSLAYDRHVPTSLRNLELGVRRDF